MKALFSFFVFLLVLCSACSKKDTNISSSGTLAFTTVIYTLTPLTGGDVVKLKYTDPDGTGATSPTITGGKLIKNTSYTGSVSIVNEQPSPAVNVAEDIKAQNKDYQIFYVPGAGLNLIVRYEDMDDNGLPMGINTTLRTSSASAGNLKIILKSKPDKAAANVSLGDITKAGGSTKFEISFPINVE